MNITILSTQINLANKFQLKLTISIFRTKFARKGYFWTKWKKQTAPLHSKLTISSLKTEKVNTTIGFCIFKLFFGTKIEHKLRVLTFWSKSAQKGYFWSKMEKVNITIEFFLHIRIRLGTKFQLKMTILMFWKKLAQKRVFVV